MISIATKSPIHNCYYTQLLYGHLHAHRFSQNYQQNRNKTEVESVPLGYIADMDKCPQTNVAQTNVVVTVVICCICSQDPLFKV